MLSLKQFISEYKPTKKSLDVNSSLIPLLFAGFKYPDVPLIKQSELEEALTQYSIIFNQDMFPSYTNHCSFNALMHHTNLVKYIGLKNCRLLFDYAYLTANISSKYREYLDLNDPKIQLERELEAYEREQDKLLIKRVR